MEKIIGAIRIFGIILILILITENVNWKENFDQIYSYGIGNVIMLICVFLVFFFHLKKGMSEIRADGKFESFKLQNFVIVYSVIILILMIGNLLIREFEFNWNSITIMFGVIISFVSSFVIIDGLELWKGKRRF